MEDTTKLEGIFQDVKDSVDRLEWRIGGVEHRVAVISQNLEDCKDKQIVISIPVKYTLVIHIVLGLAIAFVALRFIACMLDHGGI